MLVSHITIILFILNILGFTLIVIDKYKAKNRHWRIPEKMFFLLALIGGCPGIYTGMLLARHKTKHWRFMAGVPLIFLVQILLTCYFTILK
jgi:uncharacterized membrane protein YsdA (DUF1294 family)